jgi:hypothetical protein
VGRTRPRYLNLRVELWISVILGSLEVSSFRGGWVVLHVMSEVAVSVLNSLVLIAAQTAALNQG